MKQIIVYSILGLFLISCGTKVSKSTDDNSSNYEKVAVEKLGANLTYSMNDSKTFVLCMNDVKGTAQQPRNTISFVVIKLSDNSVVLEQKFDGGTVGWYSDTEVEVFRTPGMIRKDQTRDDFTTLYNVSKGTSYPKKGKQTN